MIPTGIHSPGGSSDITERGEKFKGKGKGKGKCDDSGLVSASVLRASGIFERVEVNFLKRIPPTHAQVLSECG
jgi:hypothetical protein